MRKATNQPINIDHLKEAAAAKLRRELRNDIYNLSTVARRAGVSRSTIHRLMEGEDLTLDTVIALAQALEMPIYISIGEA